MGGEMAKIGGWKTISQPSRIVPGASWRDPFFALFEKSSFSAACEAPGLPIPSSIRFARHCLKVANETVPHGQYCSGIAAGETYRSNQADPGQISLQAARDPLRE
jgi:hypothetical protein